MRSGVTGKDKMQQHYLSLDAIRADTVSVGLPGPPVRMSFQDLGIQSNQVPEKEKEWLKLSVQEFCELLSTPAEPVQVDNFKTYVENTMTAEWRTACKAVKRGTKVDPHVYAFWVCCEDPRLETQMVLLLRYWLRELEAQESQEIFKQIKEWKKECEDELRQRTLRGMAYSIQLERDLNAL